MKKTLFSLRMSVMCLGALSIFGILSFRTHDVLATQTFSDSIAVPSLRVGAQGVGGVTFFNGTIVNETTDENGADMPVTFGDNVRIDGRVFRGAVAGAADTMPFIINDSLEVEGDAVVKGAATFQDDVVIQGETSFAEDLPGMHKQNFSGVIDLDADGDEIATQTYDVDCDNPLNEETVYIFNYHYKRVEIPDLIMDDPAFITNDIEVDLESDDGQSVPNVDPIWSLNGFYITDGAVYIPYKYQTEKCGGTVTDYPFGYTGDYVVTSVDE